MTYTGKELLRMADEGCDLPEVCEDHGLPLNAQGECSECEWEGACDAEFDRQRDDRLTEGEDNHG
jgi:hypothetical protein